MLRRLLILLILFTGVSIAGGIYKWVDEHGITVFSETPPSGKTAQQVKLPPQPPKEVLERAHQEWQRREQLETLLPELPTDLPSTFPEGKQGSEDNRRNYVAEILRRAKQENADAQFYLGFMLEKGIGFSKDEAEAVRWYRKVAEQENARSQSDAQSMLGLMYADGRGVAKDNTEAMSWFNKAMEKRYAKLFSEPNDIITIELRFAKDETELMKRYLGEAEGGNVRAQSILGDMYAKGFGVNKDEAEAFKWYSKASAQYPLGFMYAKGRGVAKDEVEAMKWYRKAAEQDAVNLENTIRAIYEYGPF